jgi:chaperonin GroES
MAHGTKTTLRPLHDRILVQRLAEGDEKHGSIIIIPDSAKEKPQEGQVIAVGTGKVTDAGKKIPLDVKAGTGSCSASTPGARSSWTARSTSP